MAIDGRVFACHVLLQCELAAKYRSGHDNIVGKLVAGPDGCAVCGRRWRGMPMRRCAVAAVWRHRDCGGGASGPRIKHWIPPRPIAVAAGAVPAAATMDEEAGPAEAPEPLPAPPIPLPPLAPGARAALASAASEVDEAL